jgi:hypothetical protein
LPRTCLNFYYLKKEIELRVANHDAVVLIDPRVVSDDILLLCCLLLSVEERKSSLKSTIQMLIKMPIGHVVISNLDMLELMLMMKEDAATVSGAAASPFPSDLGDGSLSEAESPSRRIPARTHLMSHTLNTMNNQDERDGPLLSEAACGGHQ